MSIMLKTLALMALAVGLNFGVLTDATAGVCKKAGQKWDAKANKCQNVPTTLAKKDASAASQPDPTPTTNQVAGVCGPAAGQYSATDTALKGVLCEQGIPTSFVTLPRPGHTASYTCFGRGGGENATCPIAVAALAQPERSAATTTVPTSVLSGIESHIVVLGLPTLVVPTCNGVVAVGGIPAINFRSSQTSQLRRIGGQPSN